MFCFWNSCHTRHPLLETPILPQWWLYARMVKRNAVERCRLVTSCFMTKHLHTSHAHRKAAIRKNGFVENHPPYSPDLAPNDFLFSYLKKIPAWVTISRWKCSQESCNRVLSHPRCLIFSEGTVLDHWRRSGLSVLQTRGDYIEK